MLGCFCPNGSYPVVASGSHIITSVTVEDGSVSNLVILDPYTWEFDLETTKESGRR